MDHVKLNLHFTTLLDAIISEYVKGNSYKYQDIFISEALYFHLVYKTLVESKLVFNSLAQ